MPQLRTDGYRLWLRRRRRLGSDVFPTRLLGRRALVLGGSADAVRLFYDETRFKRAGAVVAGAARRRCGVAHRAVQHRRDFVTSEGAG
jgi:hypothetical protein